MPLRLLRGRRPAPHQAVVLAEPARVRRVLAIKVHDQLGDFLLATPALRTLRRRYPDAKLALVTRALLAPLAERDSDLDEVWALPRLRTPADPARQAAVLAAVAGFRPDLAFVLNSVSRSKTADGLARLSGARLIVGRSRVAAGPLPADAPAEPLAAALEAAGRPGARRDPVYDLDLEPAHGSEHQVERYLDLVRWTGASADEAGLRLDLTDAERLAGRALIEAAERAADLGPAVAGPRVGLHPGAANPLKCWPLDSFARLGATLAASEPRARLVVFDSPREAGRAAELRVRLEAGGAPSAFVAAGGIARFAAACAALDLLVCNDSGVMHIAAALGVPTLSFHALGRPIEWAPRERAIALYAERAIETIPVDWALVAAASLLERRALETKPA